jgi:RHS repeat-associated protein
VYDAYGHVALVKVNQGDVNFDGVANAVDLGKLQRPGVWNQDACTGGPVYDINCSGDVTSLDLAAIQSAENWNVINDVIPASSVGNPYFFTGRRLDVVAEDDSGEEEQSHQLYYYRARSYDPDNARFVQRDPLGYVAGLDLYEYVRARARVLTDPMGLRPAHAYLRPVKTATGLTYLVVKDLDCTASFRVTIDGKQVMAVSPRKNRQTYAEVVDLNSLGASGTIKMSWSDKGGRSGETLLAYTTPWGRRSIYHLESQSIFRGMPTT